MSKLKMALYDQCQTIVANRHASILNTISDIQESMASETKSTAGDKYETSRAMLQMEREKAGNQLAEIEKTMQLLSKLDPKRTLNYVSLGSIVYTSQLNYFISVSIGQLIIKKDLFYAVSINSPIGELLKGKVEGDKIFFRDQELEITKVI
ncbi:3-oxoacyl-ACP synthase [Psychroserpens sp. XS_ASV72]|uniref:3-oxoacyl-ACP synthase n=1 Tax=Psychroserpens sp. XS_ASV72 TaxID=3241293 RepID=UPI003516EA41